MMLLLVVAAGALVAIQMRRPKPANPYAGVSLPPLSAEGWLNTSGPPTREDLRGSVERWDITNDTRSMPHPMHLHGFQCIVTGRANSPKQVVDRAIDPRGRTPQDLGMLDTVLVWPGETVSIQIDFSQPYSGRQRYMFHCHNLRHEDNDMM